MVVTYRYTESPFDEASERLAIWLSVQVNKFEENSSINRLAGYVYLRNKATHQLV